MEREAFARARRFLNYSAVAKWLALTTAVATGVLYVALLVVLGLFADLIVSRGEIPLFRNLSRGEQDSFLQYWNSIDPEQRAGQLVAIGLEAKNAQQLATATPVSTREQELAWRSYIYHILDSRVRPAAAALVKGQPLDSPLLDRGILSLVVRSTNRIYGRSIAWLARWNAWTWDNFTYLPGLFALALVLALLRAILRFVMIAAAARATVEAATRLRRAVYHHTFRLGTLAVRALGPSEAVGIFTRELEAVHNGLYTWLTVVFREPVKFFLLLAFALIVNFYLALAFLFFALLVWLIGGQVAAYYRRQGRTAMQKAAEQLALIQESLMLMRLVKVYLMELFNQSRVERQLARYERAQMRRHLGEAIYRPLLVFLGTLAASILLAAAGLIVLSRHLGIATGILLATTLISLYWPIVTMIEHRRQLRRARASAVALFEFLDRKGDVGQMVGAEFLAPLSKQIEFDEVSLREPGTSRMLLQGISLTIQAGQRVALIGAEEMEKHALVYLIPRFLDPTAGEIRIDNHNLRWVTLDSLRAQIAIVLQHNLVFNDTVADNIGCGDPSYTLPQIIEAAKVAHAHQFIQKLPRGYETLIGDMGHTLDIGQQFLIALARAILRDPALLIVEEPAVSLGEDIKSLLDDTFARVLPGRTVIFLPHRIPTIRSCDRIFLLHKGRIQAAGAHRELLEQNELYRHLHYIEFNELIEQT
ncbi:MAG TPA: ABC transporter ATP-binding protein [Gemmataceae bacterium]|nr:ABC transporter ATP-binding protein [Gemmataceae bacterium]